MFTGLVKEIGTISGVVKNRDGIQLSVECCEIIKELKIDDSVSVDGVCQTVTSVNLKKKSFCIQAIFTTMEKTTFKNFKIGTKVNLELALKLSDRLGGHLVSGHVNSIGEVLKIKKYDKSIEIDISFSENITKYMVEEGSIALNGVSLTISKINRKKLFFSLSLIPHTLVNTNLHKLKIRDKVNLETDLIAKYLENFCMLQQQSKQNKRNKESSIDIKKLKNMGF